jgi:hypothetical protein
MADVKEKIVPPQSGGAKKDIEHIVKAADDNDARKLFMIARNRLLDVNNWHQVAGAASARFYLTDSHGQTLSRTAEKGDYIKIDLPGPGNSEGDGFDWVYIEAIEGKSNPEGFDENIAIRVRPTSQPTGENVAHFFKDTATSTFIVQRAGTTVQAGEFGRNEKPNTDPDNFIDKVRNVLVGGTAIAGLSNVQWKSLVKGLIETVS